MPHSGAHGGIYGGTLLLHTIVWSGRCFVFGADVGYPEPVAGRDQEQGVHSSQSLPHRRGIAVGRGLGYFRPRQKRGTGRIPDDQSLG
jgi:hypothetical protein